jgi:HPr kinase/phosphorylase
MSDIIHASAVAFGPRAVAIRGASGTGKSGLALQLIALGCDLIADDRVSLRLEASAVIASRPEGLPAKIEARGVGLLDVPMSPEARLCLVIDMDQEETARMPAPLETQLLGVPVKLLRNVNAPHFPAAVLHYLRLSRDTI